MQILTPSSILAWIGLCGTFGLYIFMTSMMHDDLLHSLENYKNQKHRMSDLAMVSLIFGLGFGTTFWTAIMSFIFYAASQIR